MKGAGIVRQIDSIGRVVLPMELRKMLNIKEKDLILRQENRHRFLPRFRLVAFKKSLNL